jgi:hypothetical protein
LLQNFRIFSYALPALHVTEVDSFGVKRRTIHCHPVLLRLKLIVKEKKTLKKKVIPSSEFQDDNYPRGTFFSFIETR